MPLTFLAHQLPAVAIKRRWPGSFDGVALVAGTMGPDLAYLLPGSELGEAAHWLAGSFTLALPFALIAATFARWIASFAFAHFPPLLVLDLRPFSSLSTSGPGWKTTVVSALVGVGTHNLWDGLTHQWRWGGRAFAILRSTELFGMFVSSLVPIVLVLGLVTTGVVIQKWKASVLKPGRSVRVIRPLGVVGFVAIAGALVILMRWFPASQASRSTGFTLAHLLQWASHGFGILGTAWMVFLYQVSPVIPAKPTIRSYQIFWTLTATGIAVGVVLSTGLPLAKMIIWAASGGVAGMGVAKLLSTRHSGLEAPNQL